MPKRCMLHLEHGPVTASRRPRILLVDDDLGSIKLISRMLVDVADVQFATNGPDALRLAAECRPTLILLDAEMPGMSGIEVCRTLRADEALAEIPVIFVTSHSDTAFEVTAFEAGAADFIVKPVSAPVLIARANTQLRIHQLTSDLRRLSTLDPLTNVANRRSLDTTLQTEWRRALRHGDPISLVMVDVDHFKGFNDRYGHPAGDECLRRIVTALAGARLRPGDLVARYGGEEFALLLPRTRREGAVHVAHLVLAAVEALAIEHADAPETGFVTVSLGVGSLDESSAGWHRPRGSDAGSRLERSGGADDLVRAADTALYAAKRAGRARVEVRDIDDAAIVDARAHAPSPSHGDKAA